MSDVLLARIEELERKVQRRNSLLNYHRNQRRRELLEEPRECACGCGRKFTGGRSDRIYATRACNCRAQKARARAAA